jgi:hypothetical protein
MPDRARGEHGISGSGRSVGRGSQVGRRSITGGACLDLGTSMAFFISGLETSVPAQHIGRGEWCESWGLAGPAQRGGRAGYGRAEGRAGGGGMGGTHLQRQSRSRGEVELNLLVVLGLSLPRQLPVQDAHGGGHLLTLAGSSGASSGGEGTPDLPTDCAREPQRRKSPFELHRK